MPPEELATLLRRVRREPLWKPAASTRPVCYADAELQRLLPHRDPFLLLDAVTMVDLEQAAIAGRRRIDPSDSVFRGHFPGAPVYPGVLLLEAVGQLGVCLLNFQGRASWQVPEDCVPQEVRVITVQHASFLREVLPGDELTILAQILEYDPYSALCAGQLSKQGDICAMAAMEVYIGG